MTDLLAVKLTDIDDALGGMLGDEKIEELAADIGDTYTVAPAYTIAGDSHLALLINGNIVADNITIQLDELSAGHLRIMIERDYCADLWDLLTVGAYLATAIR
jgi:hypothetical protein